MPLLAGAGILVSGYLAADQLGLIDGVWDPLFGTGSERVLASDFSKELPVPDALLGTLAYLVDLVLALLVARRVGGDRTAVVLAGFALLGALASVGLVAMQAFVVHAFCTLCLVSAALSWALAIGAAHSAWHTETLRFGQEQEAEST